MLDDFNLIAQRDRGDALGVAALEWQQLQYDATLQFPEHDGRKITSVVVAAMGGSALAAPVVKNWIGADEPLQLEVVRSYNLPAYVNESTLVICSSYSGNTEEVLSCLSQARARGAQIAIIAAGGELAKEAHTHQITYSQLPEGLPQRMTLFFNLRALTKLLSHFGVCSDAYYAQLGAQAQWLRSETAQWLKDEPVGTNSAKQIALACVGKTPVVYASDQFMPVAYKWKISWNENAKNIAFCSEVPESNHNEFMGWVSHPVEKPFAVIDLRSSLDHVRVQKRFTLSAKILSGLRPAPTVVNLKGDSQIAQVLWGCVLADFASIYVAILNGVDPSPVKQIMTLKAAMAQND